MMRKTITFFILVLFMLCLFTLVACGECEHSGGTASCTAKAVCELCKEEYGELLPHTEVADAAVAATCTQSGLSEGKHCSACEQVLVEREVIPALTHDTQQHEAKEATCTQIGWYAYETCSRCDYTTYSEIAALGHDWQAERTTDIPATCTAEGSNSYHCTRCAEKNQITVINALGHTNGMAVRENEVAASCTTDGSYDEVVYCTVCCEIVTKTKKTITATGHTNGVAVRENEVAATCTTDGSYDEVVYCTVCGEQVSRAKQSLAAIDHTYGEWIEGISATCSSIGIKGHYHCDICEKDFDALYAVLDNLNIEINPDAHAYGEYVSDGNAVCTADGTKTRICSYNGEHTQTVADIGSALGHSYGAPTYIWNSNSCIADRVCANDNTHKETETVTATSAVTQNKTCVLDELSTYTATFENSAFATQTKTDIKTADKSGHTWSAELSKDNIRHWHICTVCGDEDTKIEHNYLIEAVSAEYLKESATCINATVYYKSCQCGACGTETFTDGESLGHSIIPHSAKEATCTQIGWSAYDTCSRCDYTTYSEIAALGHDWQAERTTDIPATCTAEGSNSYHCTRCAEKNQITVINALGHTNGVAVRENEVAATCTTDGSYDEVIYCTVCDEQVTKTEKTITATGHINGVAVRENEVAATCTTDGSYDEVIYCTVCDEQVSRTKQSLVAVGHSYGAPIYTWNNNSCTAERVCAKDNTHKETETVTATSAVTQNKTCVLDELSTYTATFENSAFATQTKTDIKTADKTGHTWSAELSKDNMRHWHICTVCGDEDTKIEHNYLIEAVSAEYLKESATCLNATVYYKSCECGALGSETFTDGESLGHSIIPHEAKNATCTQIGWYAYDTCSRCDYTTYSEIDALGHDMQPVAETPSTCTETGSSAYTKCSRCSLIEGKSTTLALGHNYVNGACTRCTEFIYRRTKEGGVDYVYFGSYPQTIKADDVTLSLAMDANGYFTGSDGAKYAYYNAKPEKSLFFSNGAHINMYNLYYFKVEPIKWRVLTQADGKALLVCESALANMRYAENSNNYAESEIRAWLNNQFYSNSFTLLQKALIKTMVLDNSPYLAGVSTDNTDYPSTSDNVFLLSYADLSNSDYGFDTPESKMRTNTDYCRAMGGWTSDGSTYPVNNACWWLRSPLGDNQTKVHYIYPDGTFTSISCNRSMYEVVPALMLDFCPNGHNPDEDCVCQVCGTLCHVYAEGTCLCTVCGRNLHTYADEYTCHNRACTVCGTIAEATTAHTYADECTGHDRLCTICGELLEATTDHAYGAWTETLAPDCTTAGSEKRVCSVCGYEDKASKTALGHNMQAVAQTTATCTEDGYSAYTKCARCDYTEGKEMLSPALGHTWVVASCTAPKTCSVCGETEGSTVAHTLATDPEVAPACKSTGLTQGSHCSVCSAVIVAQQTIAALGHNYEGGICTRCSLAQCYSRSGNTITFGTYPQTKVYNTALRSTLSGMAGVLPTAENSAEWTSYDYYIEGDAVDYMWYIDVEYGGEKYRGVYFISYRPIETAYSAQQEYSMQLVNGYRASIIHWFKFEPVLWDIISEANGEATLLARLIIDSQNFCDSAMGGMRKRDGVYVYENNWEYSTIRAWLVNSFMQTAFTSAQINAIIAQTLNNKTTSEYGSGNSYATCQNNTTDKVFLLSYKDVTGTEYGLNNEMLTKYTTEYAQAQGAFTLLAGMDCLDYRAGSQYGGWWLRSPKVSCSYTGISVNFDGALVDPRLDSTCRGVVPSLVISL